MGASDDFRDSGTQFSSQLVAARAAGEGLSYCRHRQNCKLISLLAIEEPIIFPAGNANLYITCMPNQCYVWLLVSGEQQTARAPLDRQACKAEA